MGFPDKFIWGASSAAYPIEGAYRDEGKGLSIWDMFAHKPGSTWSGHNGDVAADHYHLYKEDVMMMKEMGLKAYRFSISWSRVIPQGRGNLNPAGVAFYDKLVDQLLEAGVDPVVTLFHWDLPNELYKKTGFVSTDAPRWFAEYVSQMVLKLGDRVRIWITINDPQRFVVFGHQLGSMAPGERLPFQQALIVAHELLQAHGRAVQAIRAGSKVDCKVGAAVMGIVYVPESDLPQDVEAARQVMFRIQERSLWNNVWWLEPMTTGRYPMDGARLFESMMPVVRPSELEAIYQPLDFLGLNIYTASRVRIGEDNRPQLIQNSLNTPVTAAGWAVMPSALYWGAKFFYEQYKLPIVITENGIACTDWPVHDGKVHDAQRIDFLAKHLAQLERAIQAGVDVRGYFHWSFIDGVEWSDGTKYRYGLIYNNFETQKRLWKDSAYWYRDLIAANGAGLSAYG